MESMQWRTQEFSTGPCAYPGFHEVTAQVNDSIDY